jgi:sodium-dependent dicarboxylate transporter 2/3/5
MIPMPTAELFKRVIIALIPLLLLLPQPDFFGIEGLSVTQQRMLAILVMAVLFWIFEPIPIFATSVLIITAQLVLISDQGLSWLVKGEGLGVLLSHKEIMASFASPIIILFLGGFFLAMAASKYKLDRNLARILLKPFGQNPRWLMLGLMVITAIFSMFMSNTATTAMMLAILAPVLTAFEADDPARKGFLLGIPLAANIGGIGTPIGTPPNAIALRYLTGENSISFAQWMGFAIPYVLILLLLGWFLILHFYKPRKTLMNIHIEGQFEKSWQAKTVYATFIATIFLWLTADLHGMNAYVVAMVPVAVMTATGIVNKQDLKKMSWDILWLIAGGIALGYGLEATLLTRTLMEAAPVDILGTMGVLLFFSLATLLMATFMSNTATANLVLPMVAVMAVNLPEIEAYGGLKVAIIIVAFSCSIGMSLPISTPPNALAYATGELETKDLIRVGAIVGLVGLVMVYALGWILAG